MTELRNARHLSVHDLRRRINEGDIDTIIVAFTDVQGRLQGKRVQAGYFAEHVLDHGTEAPAYLLAVDVDMNVGDRQQLLAPNQSDGDMRLILDLQTIRLLRHQPGAVMVQCDAVWPDQMPVVQSPRAILKQQFSAAADRGYAVLAGIDVEFMIFHESYDDAWNAHYRDLAAVSSYNVDYSIMGASRIEPLLHAIRDAAYGAGIDVESANAKRNPGQHAISFSPQDALTTADNHAVFKTLAKEIAAQHGKSITFIATYEETQGNSCHIQLSFRNADGPEAFVNNRGRAALYDSFVAGILATLEDFTLLYAPNINSYKRFGGGSSQPMSVARADDNRTSLLRLMGRDSSTRIENRISGSDVNLYLALAAMIAGGLYGIDHDLELGPGLTRDARSSDASSVPATLREARQAFSSSQVARTALGDEVVNHYIAMADLELVAFEAAVTDWELRRGFERM
jgi:glutamine synthetase